MSSGNRHKPRRRSHERSSYGSRQDITSSSRYNEPPPRFANRRTNGDGGRESWDDSSRRDGGHQTRRDGGGGSRQAKTGIFDDAAVSQLLNKLDQCTDGDKYSRVLRQLQDLFENADQRLIVRNITSVWESLQQGIENFYNTSSSILEQCLSQLFLSLGRDAHSVFDWMFAQVHTDVIGDDVRTVYLTGLQKSLQADTEKQIFGPMLPFIAENLQSVLEVADTPQLLEVVVRNLLHIAKVTPQCISPHFKNIVDILVGWHIDTQQDESLINFIAESLVSLQQFWIEDISFSVDLLKQFLEDMDAYTNELAGGSGNAPVSPDDQSTPEQCLSKLTALIRVFTTVLKALGIHFSPSRSNVSPADVKDVVTRIVHYVLISTDVLFSDDLLIMGNECLCQLSACLQSHFANFCPDLIQYILHQFDFQELPSNELALSLVKLVSQMAEDLQSSLPTHFLQQLLSCDSPFLLIRSNNNARVLETLMTFYRTLLSVRNIPLLETVYKLLIADLDSAMQVLDRSFHDPLYSNNPDIPISTFEAQAFAIFDITVLSHVAKASKPIIGMWSPTPTVFCLLTGYLNTLTPDMASEYPPVHFALLYSLFQDWLSNGHYLRSSGSAFVPIGTVSSSSNNSDAVGSLAVIIKILTQQLRKFTFSFDICKLVQQRWMDEITECLVSNRELIDQLNIQPLMDSLAMELLALTFSREHSVRLENASVLKSLLQNRLISDKAAKKCVPECLMRLCDTRGEIRAAYSALLEAVPTHVLTSFSIGVEEFHPPNGRKGVEGLRSCKGTHHARHLHMTKPSQVTFHGHHFRAIMGFIMNGLAPSKHLPDDWLERMYHSCQHRRPPPPDSLDHPETHPMLMSQLVCNCDALLWFWATYESAQYCLLARLKTPLGSPNDTFRALENVLRGYAQEVESHGGKNGRDTPSSFTGHSGAGLGPRHYTVHLRAVLLLQFMEHLDKLMYNAYEGSCVTLPLVPKAVKGFFRKNMEVCLSWLANVRGYLVSVATNAGLPAVALRHGFAALDNHSRSRTTNTPDFFKMLVHVVHDLIQLSSWEAIRGLGVWLKEVTGSTPHWIIAAEAQAKGSFETACEDYRKALELLHVPSGGDVDRFVVEFINNRICECYVCLGEWKDAEEWHHRVSMQLSQHYQDSDQATCLEYDLNKIQALSAFEQGNIGVMKDYLENQLESRYWGRDPDISPLWDPTQLLNASEILLLRATTLQIEASDDDDTSSITSDDYTANIQRWLKLASAYAESPLRVGCLEWPLRLSPSHALQLQAAAAFRLLTPVKSRHTQPGASSLILHKLPMKCLNPARHDNSIWNNALRYTSHLAGTSVSPQDHTPSLLLEAYRLARKHNNLKLARMLIQQHIMGLVESDASATELGLSNAVEGMHSSAVITPREKFHVMRELSKLYTCLGQTSHAVDSLTTSISTFCESQTNLKDISMQIPGNELTGRSLLTLVKWLQSDSRLLGTLWRPEFETGKKLESLLTQEIECRQKRLGLYQNSDPSESSDLFQPDGSVARFEKHEYGIGQILHLATIHCPTLAKAWWLLAGWCYRIGRKNLEALSSTGTAELLQHEQKEMDKILGPLVTSEERAGILKVLGQVHIADDSSDEDLKDRELLKALDMEEDTKSVKGQLLSVCPSLENLPSLDPLLSLWHGVRKRMFMHYQLSARAYFHFLKLSGEQAGSSPGLDDMNVTASLRLLRLLVKYAGELKAELETGFISTPTKPWKGIIPQLFSRLNHPEANVRQSVSDLLCRVGQDSPHYIIYPAIVGASKGAEKKSSFSGILGGHGNEEDDSYNNSMDNPIALGLTPPDDMQEDQDLMESSPIESTPTELSSLDKCLSVIVDSLTQKNATMVKAVRDLVAELCRITLLWDEMWLAALMQRQGEVHRRLLQIEAEMKRTISIPNHMISPDAKDAIMRQKYIATMKPLLWVLEYLAAVTAQPPETSNERNFQAEYGEHIRMAIQKLQNPSMYKTPHIVWDPFKQLQQMLMHRAQKRMQSPLSLHEISPHLAAIQSSCISMPGHTQEDEPVLLESFCLEVSVLPTKTKPKKISMIGSDGRKHTYLFKGLEDLHLDERIMQFMAIVNNMFAKAHKHQTQLYLARDYAVIPLGARSGLIQWVDNVTPLFGIYKRWQQREALAKAMQQAGSQPLAPLQVQVRKPNELFYSKIIPLLNEKGLTEQTPRKDWPNHIQLRVLKELMNETPRDLLTKELWCASSCASEWWTVTQTYCRSTAVMCMIGYIIGLGDRHLDNLLVEFTTGQVVHVDYNVCFEKGKSLRVPERVPFRMTQNIEAALGFTGVEGLFRISCEDILRILRRGRETLLTLLEAFVYDPLIDWTQSEEAAFPLAMRTTAELGVRQTRKEMEWEVAEGMLITKLAESEPHWQKNRENLCTVLLALEKHVGEIASTSEQLITYQEKISKLDKETSILHDAITAPNHPLISMQDRLSEQSRLTAEHKRLFLLIKEKYEESVEWNHKYQSVFSTLHSLDRTIGLHRTSAMLQEPLDLGQSGHEPAVDFLQKTGQAHTVESCDQLEEELLSLLQRRRGILQAALEALNQYRVITSQFPSKYLEQCRSYLWEHCLDEVVNTNETIPHDSFLKIIDSFEGLLGPAPPTRLIMATDNRLRKQIQEQSTRFQKLSERMQTLPSVDMKQLETAVIEANQNLQAFCQDNPESGPPALACFIIIALCPLSRRWLYMEQTARAARERLSDLTSRDGDWFMDELCTMSGNVSQMTDTLHFCLTEMDNDIHAGTLMRSCLDSITAVHTVYSTMLDLVNKFNSLVMPEVSKSIISDDPSLVEMLDSVGDITLTMFPDLSLPDALRKLQEQLRLCALKNVPADLTTTAAVEDLKNKLSAIMFTSEEGRETPTVPPLTQAQVILNGLNSLFEAVERQTLDMLDRVEEIVIPDEWRNVDLVKQTKEVMCTTAGLFLKEDLLFVRKVASIVDFCAECKNLMKSFKLELNTQDNEYATLMSPPGTPSKRSSSLPVPTDNQLSHPIRKYISETLICHVLGQPSYTLTCLLVSTVSQYLEVPLQFTKAITIEEICKMCNDHCQSVLSMGVVQHARSLFSQHDIAWRDWDKARRLTANLENCKQSIQRLKNMTMRFQWLHEESLIVPDSVHAWIGQQRSALLTTIKKVLSEHLATSIGNVIEKIHSQQFRISQRLQWAAGANSALNTIIDEFQRTCNHHKSMLEKEESIFNDVEEIAKAIIHLESSHTRIPAQTSSDRETIQVLQRCSDVTVKLKLCVEELSQLSDIMPHLQLPSDGSPLNKEWIQMRLDEATSERSKLQADKKFSNNKVVKNKENVLSDLEKLRTLNRQHRKLLVEVWQQLTALAKLEEPPVAGQLQPGPRAFINHQNKFGEETKNYIQSTQDLIASDMSLTSKPSWASKARAEEFRQLGVMANNLRTLAEWLLGQLLSFTEQLFQGQALGKLKWNEPLQLEPSVNLKSRSSNLSMTSQTGQQLQESEQQSRIYRSSQGIVRDLRTGKALQEQNSYAVSVWRRVKGKLDGRDPDPAYRMTVAEQVKYVIDEATSLDNLCQLYEGWTPWV